MFHGWLKYGLVVNCLFWPRRLWGHLFDFIGDYLRGSRGSWMFSYMASHIIRSITGHITFTALIGGKSHYIMQT